MSGSKEKHVDEAAANTNSVATSDDTGVYVATEDSNRATDNTADDVEQQQLSNTSDNTGSKMALRRPPYSASSRTNTTKKYLADLIKEKDRLDTLPSTFNFRHATRLVTEEINKTRQLLEQTTDRKIAETKGDDEVKAPTATAPVVEPKNEVSTTAVVLSTCGQKVILQEKIFVPVNEYPQYNFVGRILGPRGLTAKQLEVEYGCRIMIRGRGSTREVNKKNSEEMEEDLHVLVQCEDVEEVAREKMKRAVEGISVLLVPPPEGSDELKRKQLMELSIINDTPKTLQSLKSGQARAGNSTSGTNNALNSGRGTFETSGPSSTYSFGAGINHPHDSVMQNACNVYTMNMRQALASLGFAMDAFETSDCYGKRMSRDFPGCFGNQGALMPSSSNFSPAHGFNPNVVDPSGMQYTWNAAMNSSTYNFLDNSPSALIREYWSRLMTGSENPSSTSIAATTTSVTTVSSSSAPVTDPSTSGLNRSPTFRNNGSGDGPLNHGHN